MSKIQRPNINTLIRCYAYRIILNDGTLSPECFSSRRVAERIARASRGRVIELVGVITPGG